MSFSTGHTQHKSQPSIFGSGLIYGLVKLNLLLLVALVLPGCGSAKYEERLAQTVKYYEYINRMNTHLMPNTYSNYGMTMRVPLKFQEVPLVKNKNDPTFDNRQPDYLNFQLPGLVSCFKADLQTSLPDGKVESRPCYLYLLSNASRWQSYKANTGMPDPMKFGDEFAQILGSGLGQSSLKKVEEMFPADKDRDYGTQKPLIWCAINPKEPFHGVSTEFKFFEFKRGDVQGIALYVYPVGVSASEKLHESIPLSMNTFEVVKPPMGAKPGAPAAPKPTSQF